MSAQCTHPAGTPTTEPSRCKKPSEYVNATFTHPLPNTQCTLLLLNHPEREPLKMPSLDGYCAGLRTSPPGGFPKTLHCTREESENPGSLHLDSLNVGSSSPLTCLVWQAEVGITNSIAINSLWPWEFLIVCMGLPSRILAPKQLREAFSPCG